MCTDIYLKHFYIKSFFLILIRFRNTLKIYFWMQLLMLKNNFRNFCCCFAKWFAKFIRNVKNSIKSYGL